MGVGVAYDQVPSAQAPIQLPRALVPMQLPDLTPELLRKLALVKGARGRPQFRDEHVQIAMVLLNHWEHAQGLAAEIGFDRSRKRDGQANTPLAKWFLDIWTSVVLSQRVDGLQSTYHSVLRRPLDSMTGGETVLRAAADRARQHCSLLEETDPES